MRLDAHLAVLQGIILYVSPPREPAMAVSWELKVTARYWLQLHK